MSVAVLEKETGKHYVFVKGAESQIMARLNAESAEGALRKRIEEEVFNFGG